MSSKRAASAIGETLVLVEQEEILAIDEVVSQEIHKESSEIASKRCALHEKNFPSESNIREKSEFYGDAKSSYCKRCMLIHHRIRRENIKRGADSEKRAYNEFLESMKLAAENAIEFYEGEERYKYLAQQTYTAFTHLEHEV